jgi:U3 small nucleolar RNA-associated protein 10
MLYSKPSALLPHLENGYLEAIAAVLSSPATPRQLIRLHVTFLSHHFAKTYPSAVKVVVERCLWPFLLFTKAKQKTTAAVWDILDSEDCSDDLAEVQLLRGCLVIVRDLEENFVATQDEGDFDSGLQKLAAIDIALAARIAGMSIVLRTRSVFLNCFLRQITSCYLRILPITLISFLAFLRM